MTVALQKKLVVVLPLAVVLGVLWFNSRSDPTHNYSSDQLDRGRHLVAGEHIESWLSRRRLQCASNLEVGSPARHVVSAEAGHPWTHFVNFRLSECNNSVSALINETITHCNGGEFRVLRKRYNRVSVTYFKDGMYVTRCVGMPESLCLQKYEDVYRRDPCLHTEL